MYIPHALLYSYPYINSIKYCLSIGCLSAGSRGGSRGGGGCRGCAPPFRQKFYINTALFDLECSCDIETVFASLDDDDLDIILLLPFHHAVMIHVHKPPL